MRLPPMRSGFRIFRLLAAFAITAQSLRAEIEDDRIASLNEQVQALNQVVAATKDPTEKANLEAKLQRMQQEIVVLKQGLAIEARERELGLTRSQSSLEILRDKIRLVDHSADEAEAKVRALSAQRQQVSNDRSVLSAQLEALRAEAQPDLVQLSEVREKIFTKNQELRSLALQREAAEAEIDMVADVQRLREQLKNVGATALPNLRLLFESYSRLREQRKDSQQAEAIDSNLELNLQQSQGNLDLERQKLAKFDEELLVLEKQTSIFHKDANVERFMASERIQKQALQERLPIAAAQVEAIKSAQAMVRTRRDLDSLGASVQQEQFILLRDAYLHRLRWPVAALAALIALHFAIGYALLPVFYKRERLFLARRLVRYLLVVAGAAVVGGFLFDDLSMFAATLGIVGAALVISLQDVCTSICGWFVIIGGGKFHIGDRLEIDGNRGDVIDIQLLRTTLLEVGAWLGVDQPTGRVVLVPNNVIFKTKVFNFTHGHPYVWGKLDVTITFGTSLTKAVAFLQRILQEETGSTMEVARKAATVMRDRYGIDDAVYEAKIYTAIADSGVVVSLFYVAHHRRISEMRAALSRRILVELETQKDIELAYPTLNILRDSSGGTPPVPDVAPRKA
jgi:small-conductance mechanosensitive channel